MKNIPKLSPEAMAAIGMPPTEKHNNEYALTLVRTASRRVALINEELNAIGVALSQNRISSREALALVEEVAPGCIDAVMLSIYEGATPDQLKDAGAKVPAVASA
jgi:hypothetical protein